MNVGMFMSIEIWIRSIQAIDHIIDNDKLGEYRIGKDIEK